MEAAASPNEISKVLAKYLGLFQQNTFDFKYHFAPNSVIDWYGRTIRGANKIHDYLRHEISSHYDHIEFLEPFSCGPIETKTSHMRTKIVTNKTVDYIHPINRLPDMVPLKSYADSDLEDNDRADNMPTFIQRETKTNLLKTPEKSLIEELTPPASATKDEVKTDKPEAITGNSQNPLKRIYTERFSYLRRLPTVPSTSKRACLLNDGVRSLLDDSSSDEDELESLASLYTPLHYLEVKGIIRLRPSAPGYFKGKSVLWRDCNEKETRLRISYRRCIKDNQLQFALIIYEVVDVALPQTNIRRNLATVFLEALKAEEVERVEEEEMIVETLLPETAKHEYNSLLADAVIETTNPLSTSTEIDQSQEDSSALALSIAQMRTPTKTTHTPPPTPKRKPRSTMRTTSGLKRINSSPTAPVPKRSAARSLRL
uniref:Uncharacterized protein n=1 Tax=Glossina brevipalpis TaxID=37001 RepID=A0A1A9X4J9_9MUSC